jgi:hypothetical protein
LTAKSNGGTLIGMSTTTMSRNQWENWIVSQEGTNLYWLLRGVIDEMAFGGREFHAIDPQ